MPPDEILNSDGPKYNNDVNLLNSEEDKDPDEIIVKDPVEKEEEEELEISDGDRDEEEEVEEEEDKPEDSVKPNIPFDRPTIKEVKAKYPNFFKDFPQLRESYFREAEFSKMFPTVDDAKEAFEDNEAFVSLRESVISGKSEPLLAAIESQDKEGVDRFSTRFLYTLYDKYPTTYQKVVTPIYETLFRHMYGSKDEEVKKAAIAASEFLFGTGEVAEGKRTFIGKQEIPKEEKEDTGRYQSELNNVGQQANVALGSLISRGMEDSEETMTPFLKKQIIREVIDRVQNQLAADPSHKAVMTARWNRAKLNGYQDSDKAKIVSAFLARATSLIPSIRGQVIKESMGTKSDLSKKKIEKVSKGISKEVNGGGKGSSSNGKLNKVDYRKMSDIDILNS